MHRNNAGGIEEMFTHRLSTGHRVRVREGEILGLCEFERRAITVSPRQPRREKLETYVHEWWHAEFPRLREARVDRLGHATARCLWALGLRPDRRLRGRPRTLRRAAERLLPPDLPPCRRERLALGLARYLWKAGYRLPARGR